MFMVINFTSIGTVHTAERKLPRHWTVSDVEGTLEILSEYTEGLSDIGVGQRIVVLFHFHKSPPFVPELLKQTPPHRDMALGVFSICSPRRPNAIGLSVLEVLSKDVNRIRVRGLDMIDGTPILDIKPHIENRDSCPSYPGPRREGTP
jgi:tRNA-Thr(GGU) m(6)t(6)A37 methyltransferase TsaA